MNAKLLVFAAAFLWGVWAFCARKAVANIPPISSSIVSCSMGIITIPIYIALARLSSTEIALNRYGVLWAVGGALASSFGGVAVSYAIKNGGSLNVIALSAAYPAVSFVLGLLFLNDKPTFSGFMGMILISVGAVLLSR